MAQTRLITCSVFLLYLLLATACSPQVGEHSEPEPETAAKPYTETGDLEALRERGKLRLIAPRFDGADALPREGIPVQEYQRIAEKFANRLDLAVQWVYVDAFTDLIPRLKAGDADLIVTNMTRTEKRSAQVAFSQPINKVDEVIVAPAALGLNDLSDLEGVSLSVPEETAFVESLNAHNETADSPLAFDTVSASNSNNDMLAKVAAGNYQATVMDSHIARQLLLDYPELEAAVILRTSRPISWAVRQGNPKLLQALNEFLVSHFLSNATYTTEARDWSSIKDHGRIRMLTLNNPASYFMWQGDLMGFDYDLAKEFAKRHDLHVSVVLKDSISELFEALRQGEGDFIAASITKTLERASDGVVFSRPYLRVTEQLVGRKGGPQVENLEELSGMRVGVNPNTVFYSRFKRLQDDGVELELVEYPELSTETLFGRLASEEFDFMMADSHLVAMEQAYSDAIVVNHDLGEKSEIAWALRDNQPELAKALNSFIRKEYRGLFYNVTYNKYFVKERKIQSLQANRIMLGSELSPYDEIVQEVADQYGMDWRLLTAQMHQESRFDPNATSFAGARGLMQVMPRTAKGLGFDNVTEPRNGIEAGVAYLNWLEARFPGDIDFQERIYFQLAAYNAGTGHVRDARRLAERLGYDKNRWFGHVEKAMLLLASPEYYKKARFGYVRGSEPVEYVRAIRGRYLAYLGATQ